MEPETVVVDSHRFYVHIHNVHHSVYTNVVAVVVVGQLRRSYSACREFWKWNGQFFFLFQNDEFRIFSFHFRSDDDMVVVVVAFRYIFYLARWWVEWFWYFPLWYSPVFDADTHTQQRECDVLWIVNMPCAGMGEHVRQHKRRWIFAEKGVQRITVPRAIQWWMSSGLSLCRP